MGAFGSPTMEMTVSFWWHLTHTVHVWYVAGCNQSRPFAPPASQRSAKDEKTKNKSGEKQKEKVAKNEDHEENKKSGEKTGSAKDEKTKTKPEEKQKEKAAKKKSTEPSEESQGRYISENILCLCSGYVLQFLSIWLRCALR